MPKNYCQLCLIQFYNPQIPQISALGTLKVHCKNYFIPFQYYMIDCKMMVIKTRSCPDILSEVVG